MLQRKFNTRRIQVFVFALTALMIVTQTTTSVLFFRPTLPTCCLSAKLSYYRQHGQQAPHPPVRRNGHDVNNSRRPFAADDAMPATVYYVWCGAGRQFEFRHYLSVLSAIRRLEPNIVWFYYETRPVADRWAYNTWLDELVEQFPEFHLKQLNSTIPACDRGAPSDAFIYDLLHTRGGIYVSEDTVLVDIDSTWRLRDLVAATETSLNIQVIMTKSGFVCDADANLTTRDKASVSSDPEHRNVDRYVSRCPGEREFNYIRSKPGSADAFVLCTRTPESLYPRDIWTLDTPFGAAMRTLFYGKPEAKQPTPSYDSLIPNIGHLIWIGGDRMPFPVFLTVLSMLHVARLDVVYVYGDKPPVGKYWQLLMDTHQNVTFVRREHAEQIYGQVVTNRAHKTDIWRIDILNKYGGVYIDTDAIFVNRPSKELRGYEVVGSYDWTDWYPPWPNLFFNGFMMGKPGAPFWKHFMESMKRFDDSDWSLNGLRRPYKIMEHHPEFVYIEPRLQVICFMGSCHPTWPADNKTDKHHVKSMSSETYNWRTDVLAVHYTTPTPAGLLFPDSVLTSDSEAAQIGRRVLRMSGFMEYFEKRLSIRNNVFLI